jgi:hypothetical protein
MVAEDSLDSQVPGALSCFTGLAAALLRDGANSVARHHDTQDSRDDGKGEPRAESPDHTTIDVVRSPSEVARTLMARWKLAEHVCPGITSDIAMILEHA